MPSDLYPKVTVTQGLAAERTVLAAERTLLAYIRTGLGLLIAGVSGAHFVQDRVVEMIAAILVPASIAIIAYGISRFLKSRKLTRRMLEALLEQKTPQPDGGPCKSDP